MSLIKEAAHRDVDRLHKLGQLSDHDYKLIQAALDEIDTLQSQDMKLEELWAQFGDVPMDPESECIEEQFLIWERGTNREEIWHWFDQRHSKGVAHLLYHDGIDRTDQIARLTYLNQLCFECESRTCQYNHNGECRFALVHEREPQITDEDGCVDYDFKEVPEDT